MKIVLVYQCGIANVFKVDRFTRNPEGRNAVRLLQHACDPCVWYARGLSRAGAIVKTAHCEKTGDIANVEWGPGKGDMWANERVLVKTA